MPTDGCMKRGAHGRPLRPRWPKHGCVLLRHDAANGVGPPSPEPWEDAVAAPALPKPQACHCGGSVAPAWLRVVVSVIGCECGRGSGLSSGLERKRPPLPRLARRAECGPRRLVRFMPGHVALSVVYCDRRGTVGCVLCAHWLVRSGSALKALPHEPRADHLGLLLFDRQIQPNHAAERSCALDLFSSVNIIDKIIRY